MLFLCLLVAFSQPLASQEAGFYNSPKGLGAQFRFGEQEGVFHSLTAFVDIYGVPTGRCLYPGFRMNFSRQYVIQQLNSGDMDMLFYIGPGISSGMVHDHDKGKWFDLQSLVGGNIGFMFALSADAGCRFDFGKRIALDLSFAMDAGVHMRRNENEKSYYATSLSIYNNGLLQLFYPQLTILFKL